MLGIKIYTLEQFLDTVYYGTKVIIAKHCADDIITKFMMSSELKYKKQFELIEPYIENEVTLVAITSDGKLYIEIL